MLTRTIPSSGEAVPALGLGTYSVFDIGRNAGDRARRREVLDIMRGGGAAVIDSSPMYGRSEGVVGDLIADMGARDDFFLATKVWTSGRSKGVSQMEDSFRLFRTDTIDLMQVHNLVDWRTHMDTMRGWKAEGRLRYLGYTHYRPHAFDDLMDAVRAEPVDFLQLCYALDDRAAEDVIFPFCQANGVATLINVPFGQGSLLRRLQGRELPPVARELGCETWAQVCLKFVLSHDAVTVAIPGTSNPQHMADLVAAASGPMPDAAARREIVAAAR